MRLTLSRAEFELARYPKRANETLQAWDAADELLLRRLADTEGVIGETLIVNDDWGALATALSDRRPWVLSDSWLSQAATRQNLGLNRVDPGDVRFLTSFSSLPTRIDAVVMKAPKSLALLEDQLCRIAPHLHDATLVLAAAMTKHVHTSTLALFAKVIGPTRTSLAEKKARLIFCKPDGGLRHPANPWPKTYTVSPGQEVVISHAGIFAAERLDAGARLLLHHIPGGDSPLRIVDLGCGNGILGTRAAVRNPKARITFIDESYRAVASAEATFRANLGPDRIAQFIVGNGLFDPANGASPPTGVDLILNNPPFHENHAVSDATAWQMFVESRDALRRGGELWVVGNRHLGYHAKLGRLFGNCEIVASNPMFVVLRAARM